MKVVVVEDDPDTASLLRALLERDGHTVYTAANGVDGFALIQHHRPDLGIIDFVLQGSNGLELVKRIRSSADVASIKLLMVSARLLQIGERRVLAEAAVGVLPKPFRAARFRDAIAGALGPATSNRA